MPGSYRPPNALYPFPSRWLDVGGGVRLHYVDEGPPDAPPVLMLHGNPTWSFQYRELVKRLRDRYRCIVPDHVGCGLSDKPGDDRYAYRLERRITDLESLVNHLSLGRSLTLVAHDWGGMIGCAWAAAHPRAVSRLVLMNTAAFPMPAGKRLPFVLWLAGRTALGAFLVRRFNAFAATAALLAFKKPAPRAVRRAYTGPYDSWANRIATLRFVQDIPLAPGDPGFDILEATAVALPALGDKPALLAWGMRDFVFDEKFLEHWLKFLPGAEVLRLPDCGHYVLEDGGPALLDRIEGFLERTPA